MHFNYVLWFLVLIRSFDTFLALFSFDTGDSKLFIGKYPIPDETPGPLNIDTSKVNKETLPPLEFKAALAANTKLLNNGYAIQAIYDELIPGATLNGGPLQSIYIFHTLTYYWSGNSSGPAGTLVDGADGVPIEPVAFWYNVKYGSFENSKNFRDGMAATAFPVVIGPLPNPAFIPFSEKLEKLREPGTNISTLLAETFVWFDDYIIPNTPYYAYPGAYIDVETSEQYYCATVIRFIPKTVFISDEQFQDYFLTLKDLKGNQLINTAPSYPQGDTPVIQAEGQLQYFFPVGDDLLNPTKL